MKKIKRNGDSLGLSKVVRYIVDAKLDALTRREMDAEKMGKAKKLYKYLRSHGDSSDKPIMRQGGADEHAKMVEKELKNVLDRKKSALHDRPYIEKRGRNDFLVLRPEIADPFVTVVPNDIYYKIEKTCVNWLDDCSMTGLRQRLLRGATF